MHLGVFKRFPGEPHIPRTIFNQKNFHWLGVGPNRFHQLPSLSGMVKQKVEPFSGSDSTQIFPPSLSTIFLQMDNPIPVPLNSSRPCNRWKITKILSKY